MIRKILLTGSLIVLLLYTLFPFYWAVNASFQPQDHLFASPASYFPAPPSLESYRRIFSDDIFLKSILNSAIVATASTLVALCAGAMAACALARYKMKRKKLFLALVLSMTMFPQITVLGALHSILAFLHLTNTLAGLALTYLLFTLPLAVWVLTGFFQSMPSELEESAYVDGATPFQAFIRILLPLCAPGLAATGLLAFIAAWNEYLFAQSFTITSRSRTVPVAIVNFAGATIHETPWGSIMAACVVVTLPLVVLVLLFQRRIVEGLTLGAVKG